MCRLERNVFLYNTYCSFNLLAGGASSSERSEHVYWIGEVSALVSSISLKVNSAFWLLLELLVFVGPQDIVVCGVGYDCFSPKNMCTNFF